ncbi:MAG: sulfotransferase [Halieaceae bacterium]|nr:sulfotransferase [Halieaceae bacterium]
MSSSPTLRATDYHRLPIRLINGLLRGANAAGFARFELDQRTLLDDARQATGFDDFGDERFLEPLGVLIEATRMQPLNPLGRFLARANIQRLLQGRLQAEELFKRYPEILAREIPDPIVIVGLARSGTTRLHRLLASDPNLLHLKSWESVYPVPTQEAFAAREAGTIDPRITNLDRALKAVLYMSPQIAAVHPLGTLEVEEEIGMLQYGFSTQLFEVINQIPAFAEWSMTHDQHAAYEKMVRLLKLVSWFRGDPEDKPWILKSPQHMQDLNALLHVFPNAQLLCPHRDPIKVVASSCSMAWNSLVRDNDEITPQWVGREWLTKTKRMLHKNLAERDTLATPQQQYDLRYADMTADWEHTIQGVYDFLDRPFTPEAKAGMRAWLAENQQHKHGAHKYSLDQFGLNADTVDKTLMFYRERFDIPYETVNPHRAKSVTT